VYKYASLIGAGLLACGLTQQAHANYVYDLDFYDGSETSTNLIATGVLTLNINSAPFVSSNTSTFVSLDITGTTPGYGGDFVAGGKDYGLFQINGASELVGGYSINIGSSGQVYGLNVIGDNMEFTYDIDTSSNGTNSAQYEISTIASGGGVGSNIAIGNVSITLAATPLPAGLPLIVGGLGLVGLLSWRSRKSQGEDMASSMASA